MDDEYDLEAVEAQLARMQRQRQRRRLQRQPEEVPQEVAVMELTEAGLSSGTESEDEESPAKPACSASRMQRTRLVDSLDLSMSVADFPALVTPAPSSCNQEACSPKLAGSVHNYEPSTKVAIYADVLRTLPLSDMKVMKSALKPPERIQLSTFKSDALAAPRVTCPTGSTSYPASRAGGTIGQSVPVRCGVDVAPVAQSVSVRTGLETRMAGEQRAGQARADVHDKKREFRSKPEIDRSDGEADNGLEEDTVSAEEERLRQSLEKLDRRLTKLTAVNQRGCNNNVMAAREDHHVVALDSDIPRTSLKRDNTAKVSERSAPIVATVVTTTAKRDVGEIPSVADVDDGSIVTKAAYGGGAHCKRGQPTTALERSSSARRAEMSSGMHKLRVRTGGAMVQESAGLDKDGKHKVVVKRDLAHLLF